MNAGASVSEVRIELEEGAIELNNATIKRVVHVMRNNGQDAFRVEYKEPPRRSMDPQTFEQGIPFQISIHYRSITERRFQLYEIRNHGTRWVFIEGGRFDCPYSMPDLLPLS